MAEQKTSLKSKSLKFPKALSPKPKVSQAAEGFRVFGSKIQGMQFEHVCGSKVENLRLGVYGFRAMSLKAWTRKSQSLNPTEPLRRP